MLFRSCAFPMQGDAPAGAQGGQWKQTESAIAPLTPSARHSHASLWAKKVEKFDEWE